MTSELTIVVPVYGAFEETHRCLDAVEVTTGSVNGLDVVVINDATPTPGFAERLEEVTRGLGFSYLENEKNLGFVGTCNRAFAEIDTGHVLLLNSDTQPAGGWLGSMLETLVDDVASVTPTSNNATIYSIPHPGFDVFTEDLGVESLAQIVESVDWDEPIEIPVSVGFCMLMSRAALDEVGGFDPVFGAGYGEEEDWCMRALRAGFKHRLAPRSFVFHEGGASMSAAGVLAKGKVTHEGNAAILDARFPERKRLVSEFLAKPGIHALRDRVTQAIVQHLRSTRPRVIHWVHADPFATQAGGTERVVRAIVESLQDEYFQAVVFPDDEGNLNVVETANGLQHHESLPIAFPFGVESTTSWRRVAAEVVQIVGADVFHFHHGYRTSAASALGAFDAGIPLVLTIHDFNLICPRNHLLDRWGAFCGVPSSVEICDACVLDPRIPMEAWRRTSEAALEEADVVIVGNPSIFELLGRAIRLPDPERVVVMPPPTAAVAAVAAPLDTGARQPTGRILIPGRIEAYHKGRKIVPELVARLVAHGVEVHSIGTTDHQTIAGLVIHGEYGSDELDGLIRAIDPDLAIIPSVVPETFSILLSELWQARLPVVALDAGAIAARIRESGGGFLVSSGTAGAFAETALEALAQPEWLEAARQRLGDLGEQDHNTAHLTLERHRQIYARLIDERRSRLAHKRGELPESCVPREDR